MGILAAGALIVLAAAAHGAPARAHAAPCGVAVTAASRGEHRVAIVLPALRSASRPEFCAVLRRLHGRVDVVVERDVAAATGDELASAYDVVALGDETKPPAAAVIARYRELGGRLVSLEDAEAAVAALPPERRRLPPTALRGLLLRLRQYPALGAATAGERAAAARLARGVARAARRWHESVTAARRAGFGVRPPRRRAGDDAVRWYHAWRRGPHTDRSLDPRQPDTLVYADVPGRPLVLVGVMYYMPRGVRGASPGGPITRWHWHRNCRTPDRRLLKPLVDGTCARGTSVVDTNEMLHVWLTGDLRSAFALHAPIHELCTMRILPPAECDHSRHEH